MALTNNERQKKHYDKMKKVREGKWTRLQPSEFFEIEHPSIMFTMRVYEISECEQYYRAAYTYRGINGRTYARRYIVPVIYAVRVC